MKDSRRKFWEVKDMPRASIVIQTHQVVYIKYTQIFVCYSYLNKVVFKICNLLRDQWEKNQRKKPLICFFFFIKGTKTIQ